MNYDGKVKNVRKARETRALLGARFKVLLSDTGLTVDGAAKLLHVTPRTIQYWISGRVRVPYAAYRLVRVLRLFELPCPGWEGWHMHSGKLWSPEGHSFTPTDGSWWNLLIRKAAMFSKLYNRDAQFDMLVQRMGPESARAPASPQARDAAGLAAASAPTGAAGRAAEPPGPNLLLGHFKSREGENTPVSLEKGVIESAIEKVANPCRVVTKGGVKA